MGQNAAIPRRPQPASHPLQEQNAAIPGGEQRGWVPLLPAEVASVRAVERDSRGMGTRVCPSYVLGGTAVRPSQDLVRPAAGQAMALSGRGGAAGGWRAEDWMAGRRCGGGGGENPTVLRRRARKAGVAEEMARLEEWGRDDSYWVPLPRPRPRPPCFTIPRPAPRAPLLPPLPLPLPVTLTGAGGLSR